MAKLIVEQKTILALFSDKKADFLIPDYQRPYAWEKDECITLWNDIFTFAFPDDNCEKFNSEEDEYFLGPIVTFQNGTKKEIIDGQQRLTTLMLLLRAFYQKFGNMKDPNSIKIRETLAKCIWKTDEFDNPLTDKLKIDSEVATDNDKEEFLNILRTGIVNDSMKSRYAQNYRFFEEKIKEFLNTYSGYFLYLPTRIMKNCILLPIEAETQDTALRIFSTLNDRGKPLSDADIFKAQLYKFYTKEGKKNEFITRWRALEELCNKNFHPIYGTPMDELFTRYMYYERALKGIKSSTTEALRTFYETDGYALFNREQTFDNLELLADFWNDVLNQNSDRFSDSVLKRLFVLNYAPNGMWTFMVSVYFMVYKDNNNLLDDEKFYEFLTKITGFIWAYSMTNPGLNALRTPLYSEMINIINKKDVNFESWTFEPQKLKSVFNNYVFSNVRPITKSFLAWWAFNNDNQELISLETNLEVEHIFAKKRISELNDQKCLEILGNKSLLEKKINIRASDYRFSDKIKYYQGFTDGRNVKRNGTKILELVEIVNNQNYFNESDIILRNNRIIDGFIEFLQKNGLIHFEQGNLFSNI